MTTARQIYPTIKRIIEPKLTRNCPVQMFYTFETDARISKIQDKFKFHYGFLKAEQGKNCCQMGQIGFPMLKRPSRGFNFQQIFISLNKLVSNVGKANF
jgi:hypothetical protein